MHLSAAAKLEARRHVIASHREQQRLLLFAGGDGASRNVVLGRFTG